MDSIWSFAGQIGMWFLSAFIKDMDKRNSMAASFNAFIANRQSRADATVELKNNLDAQTGDLDELQQKLEHPEPPTGDKTMKKAFAAVGNLTPWRDLALKLVGAVREIPGPKDLQAILDYFKHTTYHAAHDEVPWCAAFVCAMLEQSGYKSTRSAAANSFEKYGTPCELKPGAIVVFHWPAGGQHVSICDHIVNNALVACVGGNQSNMVKISTFNRACIVAVRWPVK